MPAMNGTAVQNPVAQVRIPIVLEGGASKHIGDFSGVEGVVATFFDKESLPDAASVRIGAIKSNGSFAVPVRIVYGNGQTYIGDGAGTDLLDALRLALEDAHYKPQSGPGLPDRNSVATSYFGV